MCNGTIKSEVRRRLEALHLFPFPDGGDIGIAEGAAEDAIREVLDITAAVTLSPELIPAAADIAAADTTKRLMLRRDRDGSVVSRTDGTLTVKYAEGTGTVDRILAEAEAMRRRGVECAVRHRRIRW